MLAALLAALLLAAGCAIPPRGAAPGVAATEAALQAQLLHDRGAFTEAALRFEALAEEEKEGVAQARLRLQAAASWLSAGEPERASALLDSAPAVGLDPAFARLREILRAELLLAEGRVDAALTLLEPPLPEPAFAELERRHKAALAAAYRLTGNLLESGRLLAELDPLIENRGLRLANQRELIAVLSQLTATALELLKPTPPDAFAGWMELARILKEHDPRQLEPRVELWREEHPEHPALEALLAGYLERSRRGFQRPEQIAVLLPSSGPFALVAAAVRDGILAAYYAQPAAERPHLRFYDSSEPAAARALLAQAVGEGADAAIGPLDKEAVAVLATDGPLPVPVVALNRTGDDAPPAERLFQFGLPPEEEARLAAERAWIDGFYRALVLAPASDWGDRVAGGFRERWQRLGGTLIEYQAYDPATSDFSLPIRRLLNLDESEQRKRELQRLAGRTLEFEPRRRQDADFVFLAARAQKAREIIPQLQFHHAGDLPVYATSHAYATTGEIAKDRDLGSARLLEIPWLITDDQGPLDRSTLAALIPGVNSDYARLYALGIDAYRLLPQLGRLASSPEETVEGATGRLFVDDLRRVNRLLLWTELEAGRPRMIGSAPRLQVRHQGGGARDELTVRIEEAERGLAAPAPRRAVGGDAAPMP